MDEPTQVLPYAADDDMKPTRRKMKAPINVTLKKTRHATQPWIVIIDKPGKGPMEALNIRYTEKPSAKRGALRNLKAQFLPMYGKPPAWYSSDGRAIIFTVSDKTKR